MAQEGGVLGEKGDYHTPFFSRSTQPYRKVSHRRFVFLGRSILRDSPPRSAAAPGPGDRSGGRRVDRGASAGEGRAGPPPGRARRLPVPAEAGHAGWRIDDAVAACARPPSRGRARTMHQEVLAVDQEYRGADPLPLPQRNQHRRL